MGCVHLVNFFSFTLVLCSELKVKLFQLLPVLSHKGVLKTKDARINDVGGGTNAFVCLFFKEAFLISTYNHGNTRLPFRLKFSC